MSKRRTGEHATESGQDEAETVERLNDGPLAMVELPHLMDQTEGLASVRVGVIDGPADLEHPALGDATVEIVGPGVLTDDPVGLTHGSCVMGLLASGRNTPVPGIAPGCTYVLRPVHYGRPSGGWRRDGDAVLASAINDCVNSGVRLLNISSTVVGPRANRGSTLVRALEHARRSNVLLCVAAGNHGPVRLGAMGSPQVIPVAAASGGGAPSVGSNLGRVVAKHGLLAPGDGISSLAPGGGYDTYEGSSVATPMVTGIAALLLSIFAQSDINFVAHALRAGVASRRSSLIPGLVSARGAFEVMQKEVAA